MEIVTITEARRRLDGALSSYEAKIEYVTPNQALGRITARDITAACDYPPYRKSPFDGYAIHSHGGNAYEVVATIGAGIVYDGPVAAGQAVRLMTGCAVPDDCDTVVPQEYVERQGNHIRVTERSRRAATSSPKAKSAVPAPSSSRPGRSSRPVPCPSPSAWEMDAFPFTPKRRSSS